MKDKPRVSRHNGRAGKHGVYNPKHNDRSFDVENADNISKDRTSLNLYWDCTHGLRTHVENSTGQYPTFTQHEHDEYERRYGHYVSEQNKRNIKAGHAKRNRTIDDLLQDARVCPEETIYQIGKEGDCPPPEVLMAIVTEFFATIEERFGEHVHVLDWALHLDETSPHIHARQVFDIVNRYGECEPKQEKALEALGIPLPEPDKKPSRVNNRKITFDKLCRDLLLTICQEHGLVVETEAIYGGKAYREKNDYIIESQREQIAQLEQEKAALVAEQAATQKQLAQARAEAESAITTAQQAAADAEQAASIAREDVLRLELERQEAECRKESAEREANAAHQEATEAFAQADKAKANLLDMEARVDKTKHVLERWTDEKQDVLAEVRKFGTVDELLPLPSRFMTASAYRERVAIPRVKALFAWCKQLVAKLRKDQEENRTLRQQLDKGEAASERLHEKAGKFDKLIEILGLDRVEKYLEEHHMRQHSRTQQSKKKIGIDR